ncbi:MAG: NAD-dependent epimerase/dehydratase family protein [Acidobacteriia bacterium]|nr:NAD-dependent epimerase/dehydratase family protein [Terriglobia bacterium]
MSDRNAFRGRRVIVTGGLGFIGSNLAVRLVELGASVSIVDSSEPGCGANVYNIAPLRDRVRIIPLNLAEAEDFAAEIRACDVIFNLAGEISHTESMRCPERDLALNAVANLRFLETCRRARPGVRIVFASTRQVYGRPTRLPVDESHPLDTIDFNGIHKLAAERYHLLLSRLGDVDAVILRLTNVYGPRMALRLSCQGFMGVYLRAALLGEPLLVYGDGRQLRDPVFVDDVVDAFLAAGAAERLPSRIYNVGGAEPLSLAEIASCFARAGGRSAVRLVPFPEGRKAIDIGSYWTDGTRIRQELAWQPSTTIGDGACRTLEYYGRRLRQYLDSDAAQPSHGAREAEALEPAAAG